MKAVKIGVVLVCSALAVFFFFYHRPSDAEIPDTPESATTWMCRSCKNEYSLTAREFEREELKLSRKKDRGAGPLICPACKKEDAWRANRCPIHNRMFFIADVPGSDGICPECKPAIQQKREETTTPAPEQKKVPLM